jgi:hypothetical protein
MLDGSVDFPARRPPMVLNLRASLRRAQELDWRACFESVTNEALGNRGPHGRMKPTGGFRRQRGAGAPHVTVSNGSSTGLQGQQTAVTARRDVLTTNGAKIKTRSCASALRTAKR